MKEFEFYLEFDGKRSYRLDDGQAEQILSLDIDQAIKKFTKRKNLSLDSVDQLGEDEYRVFLEKRALFKAPRQFIYYVVVTSR